MPHKSDGGIKTNLWLCLNAGRFLHMSSEGWECREPRNNGVLTAAFTTLISLETGLMELLLS